MDSSPAQRAFLSIIAWPPGLSRPDAARLVADALREPADTPRPVTIEQIRMRLPIDPPFILAMVHADGAAPAVDAIRHAGGRAFAPTVQDVLDLGPTHRIRELTLEDGRLCITPWHEPEVVVRPASIRSLVRAQLSKTTVKHVPSTPRMTTLGRGRLRSSGSERLESVRSTTTADKLDLHTDAGHVFQVDANKFQFGILGDMRGYSDKTNTDRMLELLRHLAPDALADTEFHRFKPPPGLMGVRLPGVSKNVEDPTFAFYSRWVALMHRHLTTP